MCPSSLKQRQFILWGLQEILQERMTATTNATHDAAPMRNKQVNTEETDDRGDIDIIYNFGTLERNCCYQSANKRQFVRYDFPSETMKSKVITDYKVAAKCISSKLLRTCD